MISEATLKKWRKQAEDRLCTSALDEYCPSEFLELLDAYEELLREREAIAQARLEARGLA